MICIVCGKPIVHVRLAEAKDVVRIEVGVAEHTEEVDSFTPTGEAKYVHRRPCYLAMTQSPELLEPEG